ncbi:hypothetical protein IE4771_PA00008 (plasmid) [Rhizobium etli bv. mimosae str. IE4771]|uniref:Uncharacterized protein n=1 Tax=Rhizobium etli bv. mimosae str. IE4771 TaxID=1432050 RepID=A0A060IBP4_RHIET|nr:hypothetical protein IE4771_PA00008 [Rhizobium sp. IE4771]
MLILALRTITGNNQSIWNLQDQDGFLIIAQIFFLNFDELDRVSTGGPDANGLVRAPVSFPRDILAFVARRIEVREAVKITEGSRRIPVDS